MTRLADVTGLDRIGFPVWQAVRPMSRALSVHQGKGRTPADAQLGAMLEAVESHAAEQFAAETRRCSFARLPAGRRAPDPADFARDRSRPLDPERAIEWVEALTLGGGSILLPFDLVSLDLSRDGEPGVDRASNGVATGTSADDALFAALHELIERDSVRHWSGGGLTRRMASMIDPASIAFDWFGHWNERIEATGALVRAYHAPSLTGTPVIACEIVDHGKAGAPYRSIHGRGAHPDPELALFKALGEALQGRCTFIAGARDDQLPGRYEHDRSALMAGLGLPLPPGMDGVDFSGIAPGPGSVDGIAEAIRAAGLGPVAMVELGRPHGFHIVRAFACGLGSIGRDRRIQ